VSAKRRATVTPGPLEHTFGCTRPGLIWQVPWRPWAQRLGHCPECGASAVDRPPQIGPATPSGLADQQYLTEGES